MYTILVSLYALPTLGYSDVFVISLYRFLLLQIGFTLAFYLAFSISL